MIYSGAGCLQAPPARRKGSPGGSAPLRIRLGGLSKGRGRGSGAGGKEEQRCLLTLKHRSSDGGTCRGGEGLSAPTSQTAQSHG